MHTMSDPSFQAEDTASSHQQDWIAAQNLLKNRVVLEDDFTWTVPSQDSTSEECFETEKLQYIGGVDVSFLKEDPSLACGALVIVDVAALNVVHEEFHVVRLQVPYIPGFLAFREAPILLGLLDKMKRESHPFYPQLLMVDGNGLLHPRGFDYNSAQRLNTYDATTQLAKFRERVLHLSGSVEISVRFGLACHLGVVANLPTIGIGKNLHHVDGLTQTGVRQLLEARENCDKDLISLIGKSGRVWGAVRAMRSTPGSLKPIYISSGHRISLDSSIRIVKLCSKFRVPEPIRQADIRSRAFIQKPKESLHIIN